MRPDHYATLGVDPAASAAEIRAAYRALLREHHPDRNPGPEAVDRTKAIIAAFKVIGDFDQRNYYDWDRRRDREAAQAAAAAVPRRRSWAAVAAGAICLAAVGAWLLAQRPSPGPGGTAPAIATVIPAPDAGAVRTAAAPPRPAKPAVRSEPAPPAPAPEPPAVRIARNDPPPPSPPRPTIEMVERVAAVAARPPRSAAPTATTATPDSVRVASRAAPATRPAPARPATDIATLDQFVMNFYGQSWRYGDAPKRAVLEKTRASFVARRGACGGDTCRRNAYLDLMRDVSAIVETGKPEPR